MRLINNATPVRLRAIATAELKMSQRLAIAWRCTTMPLLRV